MVTHGNGPQVGLLALKGAAYKPDEAYPLDVLDAQTEGMIGYMIEQELGNLLPYEVPFATILTMIEVDPDEPSVGAAWRWLREASPLTSRTYRFHAADSPFLFFTTEGVAMRPLAGAANLATAGLAGVAGLVAWPMDRGRLLQSAARGVVMSVPELFFFNVRKGSYPRTPPDAILELSP